MCRGDSPLWLLELRFWGQPGKVIFFVSLILLLSCVYTDHTFAFCENIGQRVLRIGGETTIYE